MNQLTDVTGMEGSKIVPVIEKVWVRIDSNRTNEARFVGKETLGLCQPFILHNLRVTKDGFVKVFAMECSKL